MMSEDHRKTVNWKDFIATNRQGETIVRGTDLTVREILAELGGGSSISAVHQRHPDLTIDAM